MRTGIFRLSRAGVSIVAVVAHVIGADVGLIWLIGVDIHGVVVSAGRLAAKPALTAMPAAGCGFDTRTSFGPGIDGLSAVGSLLGAAVLGVTVEVNPACAAENEQHYDGGHERDQKTQEQVGRCCAKFAS